MTKLLFASLAFCGLSTIAACSAQVSGARMGTPRPPRDANCDLTVINAQDTANFAKYEQIGILQVSNAEAGKSALDPEIRAKVRPKACALGGDAISVLASGDVQSEGSFRKTSFGGYVVWAKKSDHPAAPQKF